MLGLSNTVTMAYAISRYYVNLDVWVSIHEHERERDKQIEIHRERCEFPRKRYILGLQVNKEQN